MREYGRDKKLKKYWRLEDQRPLKRYEEIQRTKIPGHILQLIKRKKVKKYYRVGIRGKIKDNSIERNE